MIERLYQRKRVEEKMIEEMINRMREQILRIVDGILKDSIKEAAKFEVMLSF